MLPEEYFENPTEKYFQDTVADVDDDLNPSLELKIIYTSAVDLIRSEDEKSV